MADSEKIEATGICGFVTIAEGKGVVANAEVQLFHDSAPRAKGRAREPAGEPTHRTRTDANGRYEFHCEPGHYFVHCEALGQAGAVNVSVLQGQIAEAPVLALDLRFELALYAYGEGDQRHRVSRAVAGQPLIVRFEAPHYRDIAKIKWAALPDAHAIESDHEVELVCREAGKAGVEAIAAADWNTPDPIRPEVRMRVEFTVSEPALQTIRGNVGVTLHRSASHPTLDQALWVAIRNRTHAISFGRYREFLNRVLRWEENERLPEPLERRLRDLGTHLYGVTAYQVLKTATEIFLLMECGVRIDRDHRHELEANSLGDSARLGAPMKPGQLAERLSQYLGHPPQLPYITRVVETAFPEYQRCSVAGHRLLVDKINEPCLIELIWSYWHEEGMLMQTVNAISRRFQNMRRPGDRDPLLNMAIDPLRPVNNLLWGFVQDEPNRLTVARRTAEYQAEYGMPLCGRVGAPGADIRSKFLEAFHNLLYQASVFFKEDFQTTVIADGFPLLNALKEVHLILAQGAHNQFGDLPWTARAEMLLVQFMLARPEMREFLQSRIMVPYKEAWMPQVDAMKAMQGWSDVTVTHFRDLGVYGEQLLLSIRYGDWINVDNEDSAKNWARYHKDVLYGYWHAYRAATGVDLTNPDTVDATLPAIRLQRRLELQQRVR